MSIVIEYLLKNKHLMEKLPRETLEELVRLERARIQQMKSGWLPENVSSEMTQAVPTELIQSIVSDNRRGTSEPGWLPKDKVDPEKVRGSGWSKPAPLEGSVPGIRHIDNIAQHFDNLNRVDRVEQAQKSKGFTRRL